MVKSIRIGFITVDMSDFPTTGLYVITDSERLDFPKLCQKTEAILEAGVPILQYRDKAADPATHRKRALTLQKLCAEHWTKFLVNDDVQLARDIGADGVHLGQDDAPYLTARRLLGDQAIIGTSCNNNLELALKVQVLGADYIAFGAFFSTRTKKRTVPAGLELLRRAKTELTIPVVAIGGITPDNGGDLLQAGANLLAVASSIYSSSEPAQVVLKFKQLFQ